VPESDALDGLIEHLTDSLGGHTGVNDNHQDQYDGNILQNHAHNKDSMPTEDMAAALHPVKFPLLDLLQHGIPTQSTSPIPDLTEAEPLTVSPPPP
jgi:hypothetical protein